MMATDAYDHEYDYEGKTVRLGVHCSGVTHEPRVRWQVAEQHGEHGYIALTAPEAVVRLEASESVHLGERVITELPVPYDIGEELKNACETLGTVVLKNSRVTTDPTDFPAEIAGFERIGWEADRNVMWYYPDGELSPRAYQIEDGRLVFRTQEWANEAVSTEALIDGYDLQRPC